MSIRSWRFLSVIMLLGAAGCTRFDYYGQSFEKLDDDTQIKIDIGKGGVVLNGRGMSFPLLDASIKKLAANSTKATVIVRCAADSPHGFLVRVLDTCNKYKMYNLSIFSMD